MGCMQSTKQVACKSLPITASQCTAMPSTPLFPHQAAAALQDIPAAAKRNVLLTHFSPLITPEQSCQKKKLFDRRTPTPTLVLEHRVGPHHALGSAQPRVGRSRGGKVDEIPAQRRPLVPRIAAQQQPALTAEECRRLLMALQAARGAAVGNARVGDKSGWVAARDKVPRATWSLLHPINVITTSPHTLPF